MIRTQIQLTEEQARALRLRAAEEGASVAELVREAVDRILEEPRRRAARERMIAAIGGFHSGLGDLSEEHDRYLADAYGE